MGLLDRRNDSATVRTLLPEIEAEIEAGAKRPEIYEALKKNHGLTLSYPGFLSALKRARRYWRENGGINSRRVEKKGTASRAPAERPDSQEREENPAPPAAAPTEEQSAKGGRKKRGIINPKDFRPSEDFEKEIEAIASKKYE